MTSQVEPKEDQVDYWVKNFVPETDLFFITKDDLKTFKGYLNEVFVIPRAEFFNHSFYNQIQFVNSYMYWTLSKRADYIIVAEASWLSGLPLDMRRLILEIQLEMGTGLTFPASLFETTDSIPDEYILNRSHRINKYFNENIIVHENKFIVVRSALWSKLPTKVKRNVIKVYAKMIYGTTFNNIPENTPTHLKRYANKFSNVAGSNCLAATLYAITKNDWVLGKWVHPETFLLGLNNNNYSRVDDGIKNGDVVTWVNSNHVVQHASYHIENGLYFNKSGQTFFEPWSISTFDQINRHWKEYKINVYRRD